MMMMMMMMPDGGDDDDDDASSDAHDKSDDCDDGHDALQQLQWISQPRWLGWKELGGSDESGKTVDSDESNRSREWCELGEWVSILTCRSDIRKVWELSLNHWLTNITSRASRETNESEICLCVKTVDIFTFDDDDVLMCTN